MPLTFILAAALGAGLALAPQPPEDTQASVTTLDLPFKTQPLPLETVLERCLEHDPTLREHAINVKVSAARVLAAMGQFDPRLQGGLEFSYLEQTPRGSTFVVESGSSRRSAGVNLFQRVKTGGTYALGLGFLRTRTDQLNIQDPSEDPNEINAYIFMPRLTLSHPLLRGMGVKVNMASIRQARLAKNQAQAQAQLAVQERVRDLLFAYWDLVYAQGDLATKRNSVELAQELLERTRALVKAGRVAPVEVKAVLQSLATKNQQLLAASGKIFDQSLRLRELMSDPINAKGALGIEAVTQLPEPSDDLPSVELVIQKIMKNHPQIRQFELALASRRLDDLRAINARLPQLDLSLGLSARGRSVDTIETEDQDAERGSWGEAFRNFFNEDRKANGLLADYSVDASLNFSWDIRNRIATGISKQTSLEIDRAKLALDQVGKRLRSAAFRTDLQRRLARKQLEVARTAIDLAKANLSAEKARNKAGRATNYDVLARIEELSTARTQALKARIEALKARVEQQRLTGELLDAYGIDLREGAAPR